MGSTQTSFTKMQGLGNDMIIFDAPITLTIKQIEGLCDRNFGIGADCVMSVGLEDGTVRMRYWNADGSPAEMCGNGLRCVARYAVAKGLIPQGENTVMTDAGMLKVSWDGQDQNTVDAQIGLVTVSEDPVVLDGITFYEANAGNPHAMTLVDDVTNAPVADVGSAIEKNPHFPNRTNVEFVEIVDNHSITIRVWERGVGETLACGTAMIACAATMCALGKVEYPVMVTVPGGVSKIWLDEDGYSWMRAPGVISFEGTVDVEQYV